jgi:hypothetical protein
MQLFVVPIHEAMDTRLQRLDESMFSRHNLSRRFVSRGLIFGFNVFVTALFPFMGDFVNLVGSFALFPLTFMFPSMVVLKVPLTSYLELAVAVRVLSIKSSGSDRWCCRSKPRLAGNGTGSGTGASS